jgi:hypothetical protein
MELNSGAVAFRSISGCERLSRKIKILHGGDRVAHQGTRLRDWLQGNFP